MTKHRSKAKPKDEPRTDENGNPLPAHTPAEGSGMPTPPVPAVGEPGGFDDGGSGGETTTHGQPDPRSAPPK